MPVQTVLSEPVVSPAVFRRPGRSRLLWVAVGLCLAGYLAIAAVCGADLFAALRFFAAAAVDLILPGWLLARRLGPGGPELRPLLTPVYGCTLLGGVFCLSVRLQAAWLVHLLPPLLAAVLLGLELRRRRAAGQPLLPRPAPVSRSVRLLGLLWGLLCLLFALSFSAVNAHPTAAGSIRLSRDMLWNVGNAQAFLDAFPPQDIRFAGVRFSYHYLTELLAAALARVSGCSCYDVFAFFAGPLFLLGELSALFSAGLCLYQGNRRRAAALPVVLFGFQCASLWTVWPTGNSIFGNTLLQHLVTNINAQATAVIFFGAFLALFAGMARQKFGVGPRWWAAYFLSFALFTLAKGPQAAIALCALAVAMVLVLLFQRPKYGRALLCLLGTGAVFLLLYRLLYSAGANTSMQFSIFSMELTRMYQWLSPLADWLCAHLPVSGYVWLVGIGIADAFAMMPFQFLLWLRGVPAALRHLNRLDPARILLHAGTVGGFLAYHLFWHESSSQIYFALFAMICMTMLAMDQLPAKPGWMTWLCRAAGVVGLATTLCMAAALVRGGAAQLTRTVGLRQTPVLADVASAGDEEAALWLGSNAPDGTIFATDRTSSAPPPVAEDGISNLYTAFSGVQCYMEGWTYAMSNMGVPADQVEHRRAVVAQLFDPDATADQVRELCRREGITCLVDSLRWPGQVTAQLTPDWENGAVRIYWMN